MKYNNVFERSFVCILCLQNQSLQPPVDDHFYIQVFFVTTEHFGPGDDRPLK